MQHSRRKFIQNATLALMATGLKPNNLWANTSLEDIKQLIGIQLYSVRTDMKADPMGTLTALSKMGYKNVEHANYINRKFYGFTAKEFKKILNDLGLHMPSGHTELKSSHWDSIKKQFTDEWKYTVEDAATIGQAYVISPGMDEQVRKSYDGLMQFADSFNKAGALCKQFGMKFGYHNHNFEFAEKVNNQLMFDIILKNTDPTNVIMQLDTGNMYGAGGRAKEWIEKYPGRYASFHVKDEIKAEVGEMNDGYDSTLLGKGVIDTKGLCQLGKKIGGTHHFIIEQESYQGLTPLECAKINLTTVNSWHI